MIMSERTSVTIVLPIYSCSTVAPVGLQRAIDNRHLPAN
jgi:hypothetical protein